MSMRFYTRWNGEAFVPDSAFYTRLCTETFQPGDTVWLAESEWRSMRNHNHYFACIAEAWSQLPEPLADDLPDPEHLRKYALIRCGYCHQTRIVFSTADDARAAAGQFGALATCSVIDVTDRTVTQWTAESQKVRTMTNERFRQSKQDVLEFCASLIGVSADELTAVVKGRGARSHDAGKAREGAG